MSPIIRKRQIFLPPKHKGFITKTKTSADKVTLKLDEYQVIKLLDYENMQQTEAAKEMNISRPTLTRIYERARKKVAIALVEGRELDFYGGDVYTRDNWYVCSDCSIYFNNYDHQATKKCPFCKKTNAVEQMNEHIKSHTDFDK